MTDRQITALAHLLQNNTPLNRLNLAEIEAALRFADEHGYLSQPADEGEG